MANLEITKAQRLDQYVVEQMPRLSRAFVVSLIEDGKVTVNGKPSKPGHKMRVSDEVIIDWNESELDTIPSIELPVLYEDDDCVVINKPVGLLTHSKGVFNPEATVASWLGEHLGLPHADRESKTETFRSPADTRNGIVHRLDRATSGVMICAKTPEALSWLQKQFSQRRTKKQYVAIVGGHLDPQEAVIDMPILRNPKKPQTFRVGAGGKSAITTYKVLQSNEQYDLVRLKPETGRTHQLRVHMEYLGHPIVGDAFYGDQAGERLFLHAESLELTLPNRERKVFTVPVPPEFSAKMK